MPVHWDLGYARTAVIYDSMPEVDSKSWAQPVSTIHTFNAFWTDTPS